MQSNVTNKLLAQQNDAEPINTDKDDAAEYEKKITGRKEKAQKRRRRIRAAVILLILIAVIVYIVWELFASGGARKISLVVRDQSVKKQDSAASNSSSPSATSDDKALDEAVGVVKQIAAANPASANRGNPGSDESLLADSRQLAADHQDKTSQAGANKTGQGSQSDNSVPTAPLFADQRLASRPSPEHSIRFTEDRAKDDSAKPVTTQKTAEVTGTSPKPAATEARPVAAALVSARQTISPNFGSLLPVRTLGTVFTLRSNSLTRLELTRDVSGESWSLSRGTVLIASTSGSEENRAFMSLVGYIDPESNRLVKATGDVLGSDGGSGLKGKRHKLSNAWLSALSRIGSSAVNVAGAVAAGRISGQPVIITDLGSRTVSPVTSEVNGALLDRSGSRGFVEVPAGTTGYVLITTLPDSQDSRGSTPRTLQGDSSRPLTGQELAEIVTSEDPARIRAALPRMTPEMRQLAEAALIELER